MRREQRLVGGDDDGRRPARGRRSARPWRRRSPRASRAAPGARGRRSRSRPTSGSAMRRQLGDLPGAAHRHLEDERLAAGGRGEDRERQADLGVEVRRASPPCAACCCEQGGEDVLRRGLAGRAGDRDDARALRAQLATPGARERLQGRERIAMHEHDRAARRRAPRQPPARRARARRALPRRLRRSACAAWRAAVLALARAARRTARPARTRRESTATPRRARAARRSPAGGASRPAPAARGDAPRRPSPSSAAARGAADAPRRSASRATVTSSKGTLRPSANSWPCSCPLPAITITSPRRPSSIARAIASRRSAIALTRAARRSGEPFAGGAPWRSRARSRPGSRR